MKIDIAGNRITTIVQGWVRYDDHLALATTMQNTRAKHDKVNWLWIGHHFKGWSLKYFVVNGLWFLRYLFHFEKIAIVGNQKRVWLLAMVLKIFFPVKVQYFKRKDEKAAAAWIKI